MSSIRLLISESDNAWFNIAVEEAIFRQMSIQQRILFLWRNADVVIIGRAQNPWKECNTAKMQQDGVRLARRSSGGGAVFQDLGNSCFTFMAGKPEYNKSISTQIVLNALHTLGLDVKASGRNDLVITTDEGEKKVSGSAYKETLDRGFHHGTLLLHTNMTRLANYLNPDPKKLKAKGINSVRSRVSNLRDFRSDLDHSIISTALTAAFFDYYGEEVTAEYISEQNLPNLPMFAELFARQSSWKWNYGKAPQFTHSLDERFAWGGIEVHCDVEAGKITRCTIFTDSLDPLPFEMLAESLHQCDYRDKAIQAVCEQVIVQHLERELELRELQQWLGKSVK